MNTPLLLSCDWGTTMFRLRLLRIEGLQEVGELRSQLGVAQTFADWKSGGREAGTTQEAFFRLRLREAVGQLEAKLAVDLRGVPLFISGMASSSIGMLEVPYAGLPFALTGTQVSIRYLEPQPNFPHEIGLISGVSSGSDVMRGEETQLIGVWSLMNWQPHEPRQALIIFPGTHAKHLFVERGHLVGVETYMTGEVFALMARHSILADSIDADNLTDLSADDKAAFRRGVRRAKDTPLLTSLFSVRTNDLFDKLSPRHNALYMSGLLIGSELCPLLNNTDWPIILCSSPNLVLVYELALRELGLFTRTTVLPTDLVDRAAPAGHRQLFQYERQNQPIE